MKVIELRPDSRLLKSNFDGYKLSLEPIPVLKLENIPKPDHVLADTATEYSFLHSSLYQLHNHLVADPWLQNTAYFLDSSSAIQKIHYDTNTGKLRPNLISVFRCGIKRPAAGSTGVYNSDFKFISEKYAVLSDGIGSLRILETGDRQKSNEWKSLQVVNPLEGAGFIIQDAKLLIDKGEKFIHCLLLHIKQLDGKFYNIIDWITLKQSEDSKMWEETARRSLQGKGSLYYLSFDPKCKSIVYSSNYEYKYTMDSVNEVIEVPIVTPAIENLQVADTENPFTWSQDGENVTVCFKKPLDATKERYHVNCQQGHIEVKLDEESLMSSEIFASIDTDLTTWSIVGDLFQVELTKKEPEIVWPYLVPGGPPAEVANDKQPEVLSNVPVSDLNSQMEECDYDDDGQHSEEFFIGKSEIVNFIFISSHLDFEISQNDSMQRHTREPIKCSWDRTIHSSQPHFALVSQKLSLLGTMSTVAFGFSMFHHPMKIGR